MKTEDNHYRVILETVYGYSKEVLDQMDDEECEFLLEPAEEE